jgi:hypothetical protein
MLKRCLASLLVVAVVSCSGVVQHPPKMDFKEYKSEAGKFVISFPGNPKETTNDIATAVGNVTQHLSTVAVSNELAYMVTYADHPDSVKKASAQTVLKGARDGQIGKDGKLIKDEEIKFGSKEIPGRNLLIDKGPGGFHVRVRLLLDGARLYQVIVIGAADAVESKDADKFFDSLQITE